MECDINKNLENCTCTYPCEKKGKCCECVAYHKSRNEVPGCFFSAEAEAKYDRSIEHFINSSSK
jgi:hypothetical protein